MSLRTYGLALLLALTSASCGGERNGTSEPQTAKEKQLKDAKAAGELDGGDTKWGKWRYTGERKDCFYVLGKRCFKTEKSACATAACKAPQKCKVVGGGPATVSCAK